MIFPPPNLTVFWILAGSSRSPAIFVATDVIQQKIHLRNPPSATFPASILLAGCELFNCLLFSAGFWALIRPWRPFRDRIRQTVLVDMGTSGDQVSWSSAAVEKELALDFRANKRSSRAQVLPDLGLSKTSPVSLYLFLILCT